MPLTNAWGITYWSICFRNQKWPVFFQCEFRNSLSLRWSSKWNITWWLMPLSPEGRKKSLILLSLSAECGANHRKKRNSAVPFPLLTVRQAIESWNWNLREKKCFTLRNPEPGCNASETPAVWYQHFKNGGTYERPCKPKEICFVPFLNLF